MIYQAVLSNPAHPEYGVATIPFPLPREEYDHSMEILEALEIGDAVKQDCKVEEILGGFPVLKRLKGQTVNVDELDYLAMRLDSFFESEAAQFQAMAEKLDLTDIAAFINLTFCCQQATVITDFSDLAKIGKEHYMNLNDGCVRSDELDNLDGEEIALQLIDSGTGVVTPYGVVYDNGMELEQLYNGRAFPPYLYDVYPLVLEVCPLYESEEANDMTILCLPIAEKQLEHAIERCEIESVEQLRFNPCSVLLEAIRYLPALECESLSDLNKMCQAIMSLDTRELPKLPIGGENTNSVIAGHRGYSGYKYFMDIEVLQQGDKVYITNLWEELVYEVKEVKIVYPDDVDAILIQPGKDMITLMTCHPYASGGKYRYLVYCERIEQTGQSA